MKIRSGLLCSETSEQFEHSNRLTRANDSNNLTSRANDQVERLERFWADTVIESNERLERLSGKCDAADRIRTDKRIINKACQMPVKSLQGSSKIIMKYFKSRTDVIVNERDRSVFFSEGQLFTERELTEKFGRMPGRYVPRLLKEVDVSKNKTFIIHSRRYERD